MQNRSRTAGIASLGVTAIAAAATASIALAQQPAIDPDYEYACHEGNYAMFNILSGARAEERRAAEAAAAGQ